MTIRCDVCTHPARALIDQTLLDDRRSAPSLAEVFHLPARALSAHAEHHLPAKLPPLKSRHKPSHDEVNFYRLEAVFHYTARIFQDNTLADHALALRAAQRLEHQLELMHRFPPNPDPATLTPSERVLLRTTIDQALSPYPEARQAVADALRQAQPDAEESSI